MQQLFDRPSYLTLLDHLTECSMHVYDLHHRDGVMHTWSVMAIGLEYLLLIQFAFWVKYNDVQFST